MIKNNYDIVVVGAGPGGSMAALTAAKRGLDVCLLEKISKIGSRVRCGEAIGENALKQFFNPKPAWIAEKIKFCKIFSPSGIELEAEFKNDKGYILNRAIFDHDLAHLAKMSGAEVFTKTLAKDLLLDGDRVCGVVAENNGKEYKIKSKIVIAADGVESRIGRKVGIRTQVKMKDMESGIQYLVKNIKIKQNTMQMYVGSEISPGGYLWVFPKGKNQANIGIGISGKYSHLKSAKNYLDDFISKNFSNGEVCDIRTGGIPVGRPIKNPIRNGLILIGDAAHHVNPLTGGGIAPAMKGGLFAGKVSCNAISNNNTMEENLKSYIDLINDDFIKRHKILYNIKEVISKLSDKDYDRIASSIVKKNKNNVKLSTIFKAAVYRKPSLIFSVGKVLAGY